jgi:hypothetical protein
MTISTSRPLCAPVARPSKRPGYNIGTGRHTTVTEVHSLMSAVLDGASLPSVRGHSNDELNDIALNAAKAPLSNGA